MIKTGQMWYIMWFRKFSYEDIYFYGIMGHESLISFFDDADQFLLAS